LRGDRMSLVPYTTLFRSNLTLNTNGSFSYVPAANYNGTDSFSYKASDGSLESGEATVTITITPVNDAPLASADDTYTTPEDTTLAVGAPGVLANDSDRAEESRVGEVENSPTHGSRTLNTKASFSYVQAANDIVTDSFSYKASDGSLESGEATVTITITPVNDAPLASADDTYTTPEDTTLAVGAPGVLANDSD